MGELEDGAAVHVPDERVRVGDQDPCVRCRGQQVSAGRHKQHTDTCHAHTRSRSHMLTRGHAHAHTLAHTRTHTLTHTVNHTQNHKITHTKSHKITHTHTQESDLPSKRHKADGAERACGTTPAAASPASPAGPSPCHASPSHASPDEPSPPEASGPPPTDMSPATLTVAELDKGAPLPTLGSQLQPPGRAPRPRGSRWHIRHALAGPSDPAGAEGRGPLPTEAGLAASKPGSGASSSLSGPLTAAAGPGGGGPPDPPAAGSSRSSDDDAGLGCREGRGRLGWPAGCKRPRRFRSRRADQVGGGMGGAVAAEPAPPVHIHAI